MSFQFILSVVEVILIVFILTVYSKCYSSPVTPLTSQMVLYACGFRLFQAIVSPLLGVQQTSNESLLVLSSTGPARYFSDRVLLGISKMNEYLGIVCLYIWYALASGSLRITRTFVDLKYIEYSGVCVLVMYVFYIASLPTVHHDNTSELISLNGTRGTVFANIQLDDHHFFSHHVSNVFTFGLLPLIAICRACNAKRKLWALPFRNESMKSLHRFLNGIIIKAVVDSMVFLWKAHDFNFPFKTFSPFSSRKMYLFGCFPTVVDSLIIIYMTRRFWENAYGLIREKPRKVTPITLVPMMFEPVQDIEPRRYYSII